MVSWISDGEIKKPGTMYRASQILGVIPVTLEITRRILSSLWARLMRFLNSLTVPNHSCVIDFLQGDECVQVIWDQPFGLLDRKAKPVKLSIDLFFQGIIFLILRPSLQNRRPNTLSSWV